MTKDQIASTIMNRFRSTKCKPNHTVDQRWLNINLVHKLNPKEQELYELAVADLISDGLVTTDDRLTGPCLVLTEKGFDEIYPIDERVVKDKIRNEILNRFRKQNSRPNHVIDQRWISHNLLSGLNPKELDYVDGVIKNLVDDELITTADRNGFCLVLTQKGFDTIYE